MTAGAGTILQIRPYKTAENKIEGLVLSLADISDLKSSLEQVEQARNYAQAIVETLREPLLVLDSDLRVISANRSFYDFFQVSPQETENRPIYALGERQWDLPALRHLLEEILVKESVLQDFVVESDFPHVGHRTMLLNARRLHQSPAPDLILLALEDVTARNEMEAALKDSERRLQALNAELLSAQESERQSVSLALHEEMAQNLVALKLHLRNIGAHLPADQPQDREELEQALRSIDGLVEEARELSWGLRPQVLDLGLTPALRHLVEHFTQYFPDRRHLRGPGPGPTVFAPDPGDGLPGLAGSPGQRG